MAWRDSKKNRVRPYDNRMAISLMRRLLAKVRRILGRPATFEDVLTMYDKGAVEDAYTVLCELIEKQSGLPEDGGLYTLLAELELLANDNACRALEHLDRAIGGGGLDMIYYYLVRGDAMFETGRYEEAVQNYEQAVAMDSSVKYLPNLGQALSEMDDSRAIGVWQQILEEDPQNCLAHAYVGLEAAKSGNLGKAMLMAKRAEKLNPSCDEVFMIGRLYYALGEFGIAINWYLEANRLGYKDKGFLYACIAACYLSLGEAVPAREYAQWAVGCNPEHDYVKEVLAEYEKRFGKATKNEEPS